MILLSLEANTRPKLPEELGTTTGWGPKRRIPRAILVVFADIKPCFFHATKVYILSKPNSVMTKQKQTQLLRMRFGHKSRQYQLFSGKCCRVFPTKVQNFERKFHWLRTFSLQPIKLSTVGITISLDVHFSILSQLNVWQASLNPTARRFFLFFVQHIHQTSLHVFDPNSQDNISFVLTQRDDPGDDPFSQFD